LNKQNEPSLMPAACEFRVRRVGQPAPVLVRADEAIE
jgi:hypothetical protein